MPTPEPHTCGSPCPPRMPSSSALPAACYPAGRAYSPRSPELGWSGPAVIPSDTDRSMIPDRGCDLPSAAATTVYASDWRRHRHRRQVPDRRPSPLSQGRRRQSPGVPVAITLAIRSPASGIWHGAGTGLPLAAAAGAALTVATRCPRCLRRCRCLRQGLGDETSPKLRRTCGRQSECSPGIRIAGRTEADQE